MCLVTLVVSEVTPKNLSIYIRSYVAHELKPIFQTCNVILGQISYHAHAQEVSELTKVLKIRPKLPRLTVVKVADIKCLEVELTSDRLPACVHFFAVRCSC